MVTVIESATLVGIDAHPVFVEVEHAPGLPQFAIIGLPDRSVQEARYRIEAALRSSELALPQRRTTIGLAPAELRKDSSALDLPMALGVLTASGRLGPAALEDTLTLGELSLTGKIRPVRGVLAAAQLAATRGHRRLIVPPANEDEARLLSGLEVLSAPDLRALVTALGAPEKADDAPTPSQHSTRPSETRPGPRKPQKAAAASLRTSGHVSSPPSLAPASPEAPRLDLSQVRGQPLACRALEIAAAGGHNLLLVGPPGSGKSMLAQRLPGILPPLSEEECVAVTQIWSAAGLTRAGQGPVRTRPFRAPHGHISVAGLIGGGHPIRPGEISLAHRGVLFLDEMPELSRHTLEALRQPLEDRTVTIVRARQRVRLPAEFMLVGAANPCPCGFFGHPGARCRCTDDEAQRYLRRISGALLDRIDLVVHTEAVTPTTWLAATPTHRTADVAERVRAARSHAQQRAPAALSSAIETPETERFFRAAAERLALSARGMHRLLAVARTIADLDGHARVDLPHLKEALQFRLPD